MRAAKNKATLKNHLLQPVTLREASGGTVVADGGALLWCCNWKRNEMSSRIFQKYIVKCQYLRIIVVAFDGYASSTKCHTLHAMPNAAHHMPRQMPQSTCYTKCYTTICHTKCCTPHGRPNATHHIMPNATHHMPCQSPHNTCHTKYHTSHTMPNATPKATYNMPHQMSHTTCHAKCHNPYAMPNATH